MDFDFVNGDYLKTVKGKKSIIANVVKVYPVNIEYEYCFGLKVHVIDSNKKLTKRER